MRSYLGILFIVLCHIGFSQSIHGIIIDEEGAPFEFVKVKLLNKKDSSVLMGEYTDTQGEFTFDVGVGSYIVEASYTGFTKISVVTTLKAVNEKRELGSLVLKIDKTLELEGVVAKGSLDALKAGIDKKIYNTAEDLSTRGGGTVQDVLNNIPSIEVDQDGNISLRGDGNVTILINGRPSALALGDGQNLLDAMPANSVERVEVVTNPSARYDPDGTSGIINIVLKKNKLKGFNGLVSATAGTGNAYEGNAALSYRNKAWNVYMNYSFNYYEGYRNFRNDLYRDITADSTVYLDQDRDGTDLKLGHTLVFGTDYTFKDINSISFSATGSLGQRERTGDLLNVMSDNNDVFIQRWTRDSRDPRSNNNIDFNLNYTRKLKGDRGEWSFNANQTYGGENVEGFYEQNYLDESGTSFIAATLNQRLANDQFSQITTGQTDFSYIYPKIKARIEAGGKSIVSFSGVDAFSETQDSITGTYFEDTLSNFDYRFEQQVHAIYGIFGQEIDKFKYQAGLRGEYAVQAPSLISEGIDYRKDYLNVFPSAHLKYEVSKSSELSLSYSKRINRPGSRQLNPFKSYADPFNLRSGNPELEPEYIDSYDFGYSYTGKKLNFSASVFHRRTTDVINRVKIFNADNSALVTFDNIDNSVSTGGELVFIYKPFSWFKNTISANGNQISYTNSDPLTDWNNSGFNWSVKYIGVIDFWKKTASLQINYGYVAPWVTPQGIVQRRRGLDLSLQKSFYNNKLSVLVKVKDVFNDVRFVIDLDQEGIRQDSEFKWLTRRFYLTLTYKFGNLDNKIKTPRSGGGDGGDL